MARGQQNPGEVSHPSNNFTVGVLRNALSSVECSWVSSEVSGPEVGAW